MTATDYIPIAYLTKPQGLKGQLRALALGDAFAGLDFPVELTALREPLRQAYRPVSRPEGGRMVKITSVQALKGDVFQVSLEQVSDRNGAEEWAGHVLLLERSRFPREKKSSEFYAFELIGLQVIQGGDVVGRVEQVLHYGARPVIEISLDDAGARRFGPPAGSRVMIPNVPEYIRDISVDKQQLVVEYLENFVQ